MGNTYIIRITVYEMKHEIRNQWRLYLFITIIKIGFFSEAFVSFEREKKYIYILTPPEVTHNVNSFMLDFVTVWYANRNQS